MLVILHVHTNATCYIAYYTVYRLRPITETLDSTDTDVTFTFTSLFCFVFTRTSARSLAVLVPITGVSWILGIVYVDPSAFIMQFLFAICNGLQVDVFTYVFSLSVCMSVPMQVECLYHLSIELTSHQL